MIACTCRSSSLATLSRTIAQRRVIVASSRTFATTSSTLAPSPSPTPTAPSTSTTPPPPRQAEALSSCPEGTVLKGLNYLKDEQPVVAKPDSEYPTWLWSLATTESFSSLDPTSAAGAASAAATKSKKQKGAASSSATTSPEQARVEELKRLKKNLKLEGRKAIKASNVLRG